jgi:hypothetical protein
MLHIFIFSGHKGIAFGLEKGISSDSIALANADGFCYDKFKRTDSEDDNVVRIRGVMWYIWP